MLINIVTLDVHCYKIFTLSSYSTYTSIIQAYYKAKTAKSKSLRHLSAFIVAPLLKSQELYFPDNFAAPSRCIDPTETVQNLDWFERALF